MADTTPNAHPRAGGRLSRALHLAAVLTFFFLFTLPLAAQFDTGTIAGSVTDSSGAVIPHATVTITNVGTGIKTTQQTDTGGNFTASALPSGNYVVGADATSFATATSQQIVLNVGATVHINMSLNVQATAQSILVTGTTTTVDTASSTAGTTLNATQIANVPINGRDVNDFLEIAPGSVDSVGFFQGSVNGLENIFTGLNIKVDGQNATRGDINGFLQTEGQEGARVTRSSVDSIQEIDYANNGYSAEGGYSLGPQMNIVTKSGSNNFHGTLFEFLRNNALDAKDYFQNTAAFPQDPLRLNQFGGNLGGPIIKNRLFFFVNYEGDREHLTSLNPLYHVLSAYARSKFVPAMQPVLAMMAPLPPGCTAIPAPASCAVPSSTDPINPAGGADLVYDPAALPYIVREDTGSARVDYNISDRDRLMFRYNISDSLTTDTLGLNLQQVSPQALRVQLGKIDETHTFSSTLLNEFSVAVNRNYSNTDSEQRPLVGFTGFFTDVGSLPGPNTFNQVTPHTVFEVFDSVTKILGNHTLKFGPQIRVNRLNQWLRPQQEYAFASIPDVYNDNPFVLQKIGYDNMLGVWNSNWDFFGQDDWKVTRRLTLNLGLRYDYSTVWHESHDRQQNFDIATQSFLPAGQAAYNAPKTDFAPRVGFSYDPFGKGKTVIHGYAGLFYMPMQFGFGLVTNVPANESYNVTVFDAIFHNPPYSIAYPAPNPPLPPQNVVAFPRNPRDPYSTNWLFGIQQEVGRNTVLTANYTGNQVRHLQASVDFGNLDFNPSNVNQSVPRAHPNFASENLASDDLYSNYNALQVQVRHNMGRLNAEVNYAWSHEIDDWVGVFSPGYVDKTNPNLDRASGDIDIRHNLTGSLVYDLPEFKGSNSLVHGVLGGWQASSILQTRSGAPEDITLQSGFFGNPIRPNLVSGQPLWSPNRSWPQSSYNLNAFQVDPSYDGVLSHLKGIGNIPRNLLRGPAFFQWDFSAAKSFGLTEKVKLQFRADLFNILNHPNFTNPDGGICQSVLVADPTTNRPAMCASQNPFTGVITPAPNVNFGRSSQTIADVSGGQIGNGTNRQVQFSLKVMF